MTGIQWQPPTLTDGAYYVHAHNVSREDYYRLKTHSVFGGIIPLLTPNGVFTGSLSALTQQDADYCRRWLDAEFPAYGVVELNDYLESVIVDALLAGLRDDSDDWMQWRTG
jgi:hypothetical protein